MARTLGLLAVIVAGGDGERSAAELVERISAGTARISVPIAIIPKITYNKCHKRDILSVKGCVIR